jgi:hypothetical protein
MKLHQSTCKAIAKCKPALMNAIHKFNRYCEVLKRLHHQEWNIPLPEPLPIELAVLCGSSVLMEDVWITQSQGEVPKWLEDADVQKGIQAVLKLDRCAEEQHCLGAEADNLCRWFGQELYAIEVALSMLLSKFICFIMEHALLMHCLNSEIAVLLQQKQTFLLNLKSCWTNPLAASAQFEAHFFIAQTIVGILSSHHTHSPPANLPQLPTCFETNTQDSNKGHNLIDDPVFPIPDSKAVILNDFLNDENGMDNQADNVNIDPHQCDITLIWSVPVQQTFSDLWNLMTYRQQDHVTKDRNLIDNLWHQLLSAVVSLQATCIHSYLGTCIYFELKDLGIMN